MADIPEERLAGNASIPPQYIPVSSTKFEVEEFDRKGNFGMWKCEVMDILVQMNLDFTLEDKPEDLDEKSLERINRLACSSIRLCLVKDQKYAFSEQNSAKELWQPLEDKFMKSIENHLYLKKRIFRFQQKKGRWKKDCPIKGNKEKDEPTVNIVRDEDDRDSTFMVSPPENHCGEWILDSACSYHMCPNKHSFSRLEEFNGGVVLMGNDDVYEIKGIETIHLKMHNGVVKTLTEVRYVPDMKKNLFSLGVLESNGYKVIMYGGVLRAICGALIILRDTRIGNLYFLDGSIVTGTTTVSKSLEDAEADNSRLWHMRLGHAGEKALQGLAKQEKSQEKEKQSGDAQQVELETSVIPIKTVQTIPTERDSDES
uniref:Uncharacterized protein n=1 Tax=Populus alba TaxID=43335 RepID=A0A4U5QC88_POPAL|nr:hypothetical protein D5086_0000109800 [Populus alba]